MLDAALVLMDSVGSDNATGAGNQQERLSIATIASVLGYLLSGFALGRREFHDRLSAIAPTIDVDGRFPAAFNVSQNDVTPLELFRHDAWVRNDAHGWERWLVLRGEQPKDIQASVVPFFRQFHWWGKANRL